MKVLIFASNFPRSYSEAFVSGLVKNGFNQAKAVSDAGTEVTVITDGPHKGEWKISGINVHGVGKGVSKGVLKALILDVKMTWSFLRLGPKRFDVIHIHSGNLLLFFLLKKLRIVKTKVVYTAHGTTTPELRAHHSNKPGLYDFAVRLNGKVQEWVDSIMWNNADRIISVSKFQVREMRDIYGVTDERIVQIYNGVDSDLYRPDKKSGDLRRNKLDIAESVPVVLFVGRMVWKKGVHLLLDAVPEVIKKNPEVRFVFVLGEMGKGFDVDYVREIREQYKTSPHQDNLFFIENVSEEELPSYYQMADICVFTSLQYESLPTVIYEAMSCGVPVVTQGSWGTPEVINDVLLTEAELCDQTLARTISSLLNDTLKTKAIQDRYLEIISKFYWNELAKQYLNLYERLRK